MVTQLNRLALGFMVILRYSVRISLDAWGAPAWRNPVIWPMENPHVYIHGFVCFRTQHVPWIRTTTIVQPPTSIFWRFALLVVVGEKKAPDLHQDIVGGLPWMLYFFFTTIIIIHQILSQNILVIFGRTPYIYIAIHRCFRVPMVCWMVNNRYQLYSIVISDGGFNEPWGKI